jgi:hypothetical protein
LYRLEDRSNRHIVFPLAIASGTVTDICHS